MNKLSFGGDGDGQGMGFLLSMNAHSDENCVVSDLCRLLWELPGLLGTSLAMLLDLLSVIACEKM